MKHRHLRCIHCVIFSLLYLHAAKAGQARVISSLLYLHAAIAGQARVIFSLLYRCARSSSQSTAPAKETISICAGQARAILGAASHLSATSPAGGPEKRNWAIRSASEPAIWYRNEKTTRGSAPKRAIRYKSEKITHSEQLHVLIRAEQSEQAVKEEQSARRARP